MTAANRHYSVASIVGVADTHATAASNAGRLGQIEKAGARLPDPATTLGLMASRRRHPQQRLITDRRKPPKNAFWRARDLSGSRIACAAEKVAWAV